MAGTAPPRPERAWKRTKVRFFVTRRTLLFKSCAACVTSRPVATRSTLTAVAVAVRLGVGVRVRVGLAVAALVRVRVAVGVRVRVAVGVADGVPVGGAAALKWRSSSDSACVER